MDSSMDLKNAENTERKHFLEEYLNFSETLEPTSPFQLFETEFLLKIPDQFDETHEFDANTLRIIYSCCIRSSFHVNLESQRGYLDLVFKYFILFHVHSFRSYSEEEKENCMDTVCFLYQLFLLTEIKYQLVSERKTLTNLLRRTIDPSPGNFKFNRNARATYSALTPTLNYFLESFPDFSLLLDTHFLRKVQSNPLFSEEGNSLFPILLDNLDESLLKSAPQKYFAEIEGKRTQVPGLYYLSNTVFDMRYENETSVVELFFKKKWHQLHNVGFLKGGKRKGKRKNYRKTRKHRKTRKNM
jgi:hypothetical protein